MARTSGNFCMSVDFGTTNTLVFLKNDGVVVNEASLIALRSGGGKSPKMSVVDFCRVIH